MSKKHTVAIEEMEKDLELTVARAKQKQTRGEHPTTDFLSAANIANYLFKCTHDDGYFQKAEYYRRCAENERRRITAENVAKGNYINERKPWWQRLFGGK